MKRVFVPLCLSLSLLLHQKAISQDFVKLPFEMPKVNVPSFKPDTFNIVKYGAVGDGTTLNTTAINTAIDACNANGGGVVLIPAGLWLTGPIVLKSNVNLFTQNGALVLFSANFDHYPMIDANYEGQNTKRCMSPISGKNLSNIAITGTGIFDGNGQAWRMIKKSKQTETQWKSLVKSGGVLDKAGTTWYPSAKSLKGAEILEFGDGKVTDFDAIKDYLRPVMLSLNTCTNVLLDGVTFQNSPSWCVHPLLCEHITVNNVKIINPWYAQNGDAIDLESCRIGKVTNCTFDAGDDAICIKSGRNEEGRRRGKPTELFVITNCTVFRGHGGFVIGSEMSGGVRNMYISDCTFVGTDIGLRFKSTRGRGGVVEKIWMENISMINILAEAISFNMYYSNTSPVPEADEKQVEVVKDPETVPTINDGTPIFRDFYIKNVSCNGADVAILAQGLPEMPIRNINFENVFIKSNKGMLTKDADNISFNNLKLTTDGIPATIDNSKNITINGLKSESAGKLLLVKGKLTENVKLIGKSASLTDALIEIAPETSKTAIVKK